MKFSSFSLFYFWGLGLILSGLVLVGATNLKTEASVVNVTRPTAQALQGQAEKEKNYLEKLFGTFTTGEKPATQHEMSAVDWLIAVPATLFYGQVALFAILWILFSSSWFGAITGLIVVGLCLAFTLPKPPRPIGLFVLASINFLLALGITFNVAFQEGVPQVLISLVPLGWLVWWTFEKAFLKKKLR